MAKPTHIDAKPQSLQERGILNPNPQNVKDPLFQTYDFFDARDLLQVKYEMLRRVQKDGWSVTQTASTFGLSRPTYYQAQQALEQEGLAGLIPRRKGPKSAHKLSEEVLRFVEQSLEDNPTLSGARLAVLVKERFELNVHPGSIKRALALYKKKGKTVDAP